MLVRVSTDHQKEEALDAQESVCREILQNHGFDCLPVDILRFRGTGESNESPHLAEIETRILSRRYTVFATEQLDRILRDAQVLTTVWLARRFDVRIVTTQFDSDNEISDVLATFQGMISGQEQGKTSDRIKRSLRESYRNGVVAFPVPWLYEIRKPEGYEGPTLEEHVHPTEDARKWYRFGRDWILDRGGTWRELYETFRDLGLPLPRQAKKWSAILVRRTLTKPAVSGRHPYGRTTTQKSKRSLKRVSVRQPEDKVIYRDVPHWRIMSEEDRLALEAAGTSRRPWLQTGVASKQPRKPSLFSSHIRCVACGHRLLAAGQHHNTSLSVAERRLLSCENARDGLCPVNAQINVGLLTRRVFAEILGMVEQAGLSFNLIRHDIAAELEDQEQQHGDSLPRLKAEEERLTKAIRRLVRRLTEDADDPEIDEMLNTVKQERRSVQLRIAEASRRRDEIPTVPTGEELIALIRDSLSVDDLDDPQLTKALVRLVPEMWAYPFAELTGKKMRSFALCTIDLAGFIPALDMVAKKPEFLRKTIWIPGFTIWESYANALRGLKLRDDGRKVRDLKKDFGVSENQVKDAQKTIKLMDQMGLRYPYMPLNVHEISPHDFRGRVANRLVPMEGHEPWGGSLDGLPPLPPIG